MTVVQASSGAETLVLPVFEDEQLDGPLQALVESGEANGTESIVKAGGWIGIATAVVAWYASFASVTNKTFGRIVMPVRELK